MVSTKEPLIQVKILPSAFSSPQSFFAEVEEALTDRRLKAGEPTILLFNELVFKNPILRKESKEIIGRLSELLAKHGETYAFLTIGELSGKGLFSNTAYIVRPDRDEKGRRWLAYPKKTLAKLDKDTIATIAKGERLWKRKAARNRLESHFKRRGERGRAGEFKEFETPSITIRGRKVSIAACADVAHSRTAKESDLVIVPARELALRMLDFVLLQGKEGSRIVFSDAWTHKVVARELNYRWTHDREKQEIYGSSPYDFRGPLLLRTKTPGLFGTGAIRRLKKGRPHRL
ncbi:MAG: hypothetical protein NT067_01840 [Candidatus Diapherotrites archaeon]|nr:hypothetical protein [Candidatus Diapherotrites archaeon]